MFNDYDDYVSGPGPSVSYTFWNILWLLLYIEVF